MKTMTECMEARLGEAFLTCGYEEKYGKVTVSNRPDLCEFQCNGAMAAAKAYKKAPLVIAGEVVEKLAGIALFSKAECVPPGFINLTLSEEALAEYVNEMALAQDFGCEKVKNPRTVILDYGGANAAKPLHVGHLRSAIIGECVKRIERFVGNNVISDVHLGDWGLQMGLIIEELRERKPQLSYFDDQYCGEYPKEPPFTIGELEEIYPCASAKSKQDPVFMERAHNATVRLQRGDRACRALWNHIMAVSKEDLKRNYDSLNVSFDLWKGESDAQPYIPAMIEDLKNRGIAHESQGAVVVEVARESDTREIPPCLIQKSDGAALYATSDLGTIIEREKLYQPDTYVYMTDKRQEMHFTQVFRTAQKAGLVKPETQMVFLGFGTMNGKDGKPFKTRSGGVMRLEYLIEDIQKAVYDKVVQNRDLSEEEAREVARKVGLAALKYGDLSNQAAKDYIFDMERFTSFEGNTGPYILYTIVRIKSILEKYRENGGNTQNLKILPAKSQGEKNLALALLKFQEVLYAAHEEYAPHKICQYLYEVSNALNGFYHDTRILAEEDCSQRESYIALIALVKSMLECCVGLLGIEVPDRM